MEWLTGGRVKAGMHEVWWGRGGGGGLEEGLLMGRGGPGGRLNCYKMLCFSQTNLGHIVATMRMVGLLPYKVSVESLRYCNTGCLLCQGLAQEKGSRWSGSLGGKSRQECMRCVGGTGGGIGDGEERPMLAVLANDPFPSLCSILLF